MTGCCSFLGNNPYISRVRNLIFLALITMAGCSIAPTLTDSRRPGHAWDGHNDKPSRVIYEATGHWVAPYIFGPHDPVHDVYEWVGCWHFASDSLRGLHNAVWAETVPHQSVSPYTGKINARAPYGPTDTLYWPDYDGGL